MAILALAEDLDDLKARLGRILVGYTVDRQPVYAEELKAAGPMTLLLRQALQPNLVQTVEGVPAFVHAGPSPTSPMAATRSSPPKLRSGTPTSW